MATTIANLTAKADGMGGMAGNGEGWVCTGWAAN